MHLLDSSVRELLPPLSSLSRLFLLDSLLYSAFAQDGMCICHEV